MPHSSFLRDGTTLETQADHMLSIGPLPAHALIVYAALLAPAMVAAQTLEFESDRQFSEHYGWIYNNLSGGLHEAQRTGRPLMVVIRCPP
jgi:hypothetical protein